MSRKDLNKFVDSWNPKKEEGHCQGSLIKTNRQTMIDIFKLPVRGVSIRRWGGPEWEAANFLPTAELERKGYSIAQCSNETIKAQLEFVTHALHWKRPRSEFPKFIVKIVEEGTTHRWDWAMFYVESFRAALKRTRQLKRT